MIVSPKARISHIFRQHRPQPARSLGPVATRNATCVLATRSRVDETPATALPTLIVLACLALPSVAQAITVRVPSRFVSGHMAGDLLVWGEPGKGRLRVRGRRRRCPQRAGQRPPAARSQVADLAVGGAGVFVARTSYGAEPDQSRADRYTLAPLGGPGLIDCAPPTNGFDPLLAYDRRIAGDGTTVVAPAPAVAATRSSPAPPACPIATCSSPVPSSTSASTATGSPRSSTSTAPRSSSSMTCARNARPTGSR